MNIINIIKAEIERLKDGFKDYPIGDKVLVCNHLLSFIESLEKHYYVYKDGHCVSDYKTYLAAKCHADKIGGEVATESLEKEQEKQESSIFTKAEMWVARNYPKTVGEEFDKLVTVYLSGIAEGERTVDDAPKIKGWVARDKSGDLYFFHYDCKPHRTDGIFHSECSEDVFHIDNFLFPEVDWQTEPIEVKLTISLVKTE